MSFFIQNGSYVAGSRSANSEYWMNRPTYTKNKINISVKNFDQNSSLWNGYAGGYSPFYNDYSLMGGYSMFPSYGMGMGPMSDKAQTWLGIGLLGATSVGFLGSESGQKVVGGLGKGISWLWNNSIGRLFGGNKTEAPPEEKPQGTET